MATSLFPPKSIAPERGDAYGELLRGTRGLAREQAASREQWLQKLAGEHKYDQLFELEIILKGLACFGNPRNHPGPPRRTPVVAQDFREPLALSKEALARVVALSRTLLFDRDRAFTFQRYLETVLPDDRARARLASQSDTQGTPAESLFHMRAGMASLVEVTSGLAKLPRVPFRMFYAMLGLAQREVARSVYFNPLSALEFRPEFDRITHPRILELMRTVPGEHARRLVALSFLALFRMLRYLSLLESAVYEPNEGSRRSAGVVYVVMSVLRSDARALTGHLTHRAGPEFADGFERELFAIPAAEMRQHYNTLLGEGHRLLEVKATLEGISANLRLEMRRAFEHDFPAPDAQATIDVLRASVARTVKNLRPALQNAVLFLGKSLGVKLDEQGVFDDAAARRMLSERLRRDVWMFAQIVRAFSHKARNAHGGEVRWTGVPPLQFVREFLAYFRAMGYPLLRASDYPRFDPFLKAMAALGESDLLDPDRLQRAIAECEQFYVFLTDLFDAIGRRDELSSVPFDRRAAALSLKLYLGSQA